MEVTIKITPLLDDHYASRISDMHTLVNKRKMTEDKSLFNILIDFIKGN